LGDHHGACGIGRCPNVLSTTSVGRATTWHGVARRFDLLLDDDKDGNGINRIQHSAVDKHCSPLGHAMRKVTATRVRI
jgi:hypothetical protein